jgi:small subunit ribosomal protein S20
VATHKSAEKRARSSERKRQVNREYLSAVRTELKKARAAIAEVISGVSKDEKAVMELVRKAQSSLAKAASKGIVKKNTASRYTSRMIQTLKKNAK